MEVQLLRSSVKCVPSWKNDGREGRDRSLDIDGKTRGRATNSGSVPPLLSSSTPSGKEFTKLGYRTG